MRSYTRDRVVPALIISLAWLDCSTNAFQTLPTRSIPSFSSKHEAKTPNFISLTPKYRSTSHYFSKSNGMDSKLQADAVADNMDSGEAAADTASFLKILWRFTRPHTLIGSALAIPALHIYAAPSFKDAFTVSTLISSLFAMIPSLLMNLYITGLNQITDVEIDKVNKPTLPIASGELSPQNATVIVTIALILSLVMGLSHPVLGSEGLNVALWGSMILGTVYSLPPFRLKRFPLLAAVCIVSVRGTIINAGFFAHAKAAAFARTGVAASVMGCLADTKCLFSCVFFAVFGIVIALMKDVPDAAGDALFKIRSFTVRVGQAKVFKTSRRLLAGLFFCVSAGFGRAALQSQTRVLTLCRLIVAACSLAAGQSVRKEAVDVNPEDSGMVYDYYMHLWKLFYLSYLVLPFAR